LWAGDLELAPVVTIGAIGLSILLAWLSWRFVERPFRVPATQGGLSQGRIFGLSAAGGFVVLAACSVIVLDNGAERRASPETMAVFAQATQRSALENRCRAMAPATGLCVLGGAENPPEDATVLVWGDSHAAAMLPGFDAYFARQGLIGTAAVKTACAPLLGLVRVDRGSLHGCDKFNADVLRYIETHPNIDTVILAARWALNAERTRAPGEGGGPAILGRAGASGTAPADNAALFRAGLVDTVAALRTAGKTVRLVEGVPEMGFSVPTAWMNQSFMGNAPAAVSWPEYEARHHQVTPVLADLVSTYDVEIIPLATWLCRPICQTEQDGALLYRDDDHLSIYAAEQILPKLLAREQ